MNKTYFLLPMLLLTGCYTDSNLDTNFDDTETEFSRPSLLDEPVTPVDDTQFTEQPAAQAITIPTQPVEPIQPVIPQPQPTKPTLSADGTMIELPAQQIYIGTPAPTPAPIRQPNPYTNTVLSYSSPDVVTVPPPQPAYPSDVVLLQYTAYPNTFVQCPAMDTMCISAYEQQGFVQLQNKPRFAGYQDVTSQTDYPTGRWRSNNNIPRW